MSPSVESLFEKAGRYLTPEKVQQVREAYDFAAKAHAGQVRVSGEPYIVHPLETAVSLGDLQLDVTTLIAALLHDVHEDCGVSLDEVAKNFGTEVRKLVDGVSKLSQIEAHAAAAPVQKDGRASGASIQAENLKKMLVAMAEDVRVILIKLADRLHNMQTIRALPIERRVRIARETLEIYAPLAHRLGIWSFKWQLEDLAFRTLYPEKYREISKLLAAKRTEREQYVGKVIQVLRDELKKANVEADITGRAKHIYSIFQKMQRYSAQGRDFEQIYDLVAVRVLVDDLSDCYAALGVVHSLWHPLPGQFDDYIGNPRENGYQSLHTTVMGPGTTPVEIQIRTHTMHHIAEYGVAAHWRYKEGGSGEERFDQKMTWLRQLLEWQREGAGAEEFVESLKTDIFPEQLFVYTPKGDIKELPAGSTPLDFAYRIHTELGHRCTGAKVNAKMVSLSTPLQNGDVVEIIVSKLPKGPSLDWLNPDAGFVKTANARDKIKAWFRKREKAENIDQGRALMDNELKRLNVGISEEDLALLLGYETADEFLSSLGSGGLSVHQIAAKLLTPQDGLDGLELAEVAAAKGEANISVMGMGDLYTRLPECCSPVPGDDIIGFVTRSRGVTIHRKDCKNIINEDETDRLVDVTWGQPREFFSAKVTIEAWDRVGLLRDITTIVSAEKVNIASARSTHHKDGMVSEHLTLHTTGATQLSKLLVKLEGVDGVVSVERSA